jgi:ATP-dependent helicase/nuclease subunit B
MFEPSDSPRIFAIPVGCDFLRTFVQGLRQRNADLPPEALGRVEIFVNTQRMARRLKEILIDDGALLLPKIRVITEIANHPRLPILLPKPVSKLRRQLILAQLVGKLLDADNTLAPQSAKYDLAESLSGLLDEMQGEGIAIQTLSGISVEDQSGHWKRSLEFLNILASYWDNDSPIDAQDRQRNAALGFARSWVVSPPQHPILAIGSTGSRGETALFLRAVAALPQGAIVLPGLDRALKQNDWDALTAADTPVDNPQSTLAGFCKSAGVSLSQIADWTVQRPVNTARNALVSLALRPAPFTDQWLDDGPRLVPLLKEAVAGLSLVQADSPKEEAMALALRLRAAAEAGQRAVLITPDRVLTRRVTAVLQRWNILPDDSAGRPLHLTPPGIFLRMIAGCMGSRLTPLDMVALLKHPLSDSGTPDGTSRRFAHEYERSKLRGGAPFVDFDNIRDWADKDVNDPQRRVWADWVVRCLAPFESITNGDLAAFLTAHLLAAETLAAGPIAAENHGLWLKENGKSAAGVFAKLADEVDVAGGLSVADYQALFANVMKGVTVREAIASHPLIAIWGTLEARVESADLVILGGLNDTVWPGVENPDPWLNRSMRAQIGLPTPERLIGLSAHDFQQGCGAAQLIISRSIRDGDSPTVPSRWIVRLLNLLNGLGAEGEAAVRDVVAKGHEWLTYARLVDRPQKPVPTAPRPAPVPPAHARLKQLSVTQVERLIRDPYAIYAQKILQLKKLDPLGREPDALIRGIALHAVVERFVTTWPDTLPEDARTALLSVAEEALQDEVPWPALQRIWLARLARIAGWFVAGEHERRGQARIVGQEVQGERRIAELDFTLTAKADRIDQDADGGLIIYDYKSGSPPSKDEIKYFKKQLHLEAAIVAEGGFDGVPQGIPVAWEYIGLSGSGQETAGKTLREPTSVEEAELVWRELTELVSAYRNPAKGFPARPRMQKMGFSYEYDHLARKGEWEESDAPVDIPVGEADQ